MKFFRSKGQKQADREDKLNAPLEKRGLKIAGYSAADIANKNTEDIARILSSLINGGVVDAHMALTLAKPAERAKISYLNALVEQNWIIIRQNEAILRRLDIVNKK